MGPMISHDADSIDRRIVDRPLFTRAVGRKIKASEKKPVNSSCIRERTGLNIGL